MKWICVPALSAFPDYRADWDRLNNELYAGHPLYDSRFIAPLIRYFATPRTRLAVLRDHDHVVGLTLIEPRRTGQWQTFTPSQLQASPILLPPALFPETNHLFSQLPGFPALTVDWLAQDAPFSPCFSGFSGAPLSSMEHAITMNVSTRQTFSEYWAHRSKNLRQNLTRQQHRLEREHQIPHLVTLSGRAEVLAMLHQYGLMESAGWKGKNGTAIHPENTQGRFYAEVFDAFAAKGEARAYCLYLNDRLASIKLCILAPHMMVILKTTYDEALAEFAPGRILQYLMFQQEMPGHAYETIEFYNHATADALRWSTGSRPIRHVTLYRNSGVQYLIRASQRLRAPRPEAEPAHTLSESHT